MSGSKQWTFSVAGMTCDHCAQTIDSRLDRLPGVIESTTRFDEGISHVVTEADVEEDAIVDAIIESGYSVVSVQIRQNSLGDDPVAPVVDEQLDLLISHR